MQDGCGHESLLLGSKEDGLLNHLKHVLYDEHARNLLSASHLRRDGQTEGGNRRQQRM